MQRHDRGTISMRRALAPLAVAAMAISACGGDDDTGSESPSATTAAGETPDGTGPSNDGESPTGRCGDPDRLGSTFNFYNWADYIDEEVLSRFQEECGVVVTMDTYASNEEAIAKIQAGNSGYSLLIPTDYAAGILISEGLALELDKSLIPNADRLDPDQLDLYYDPGNVYTLPYQYSTTGLAYDASRFDAAPTSWSALFDQNEHCGQSSLLDDQRETIGAALVYLGYDWNETDADAHEEALDLLLDARNCVSAFDSVNFIGNLASGEVVVSGAWGFAAGIAHIDNPEVRFVIPDEGGTIWQDNFVIPADAPDPYTAHVFINYMLEPDIGALITEFTIGYTPNLDVEPLLSDDYRDIIAGTGLELTDEVREKLVWQVRDESHAIFANTWTTLLAAG